MQSRPFLDFISTQDHHLIRAWAEYHMATPQKIDYPDAQGDEVGLRLDFPGNADERDLSAHQPIEWDEFFRLFDELQLSFLYLPVEQMDTDMHPQMAYRFIPSARVE